MLTGIVPQEMDWINIRGCHNELNFKWKFSASKASVIPSTNMPIANKLGNQSREKMATTNNQGGKFFCEITLE